MAEPHERDCAVCTNDFTRPKILPCGHLLCRECVISWIIFKPKLVARCELQAPVLVFHEIGTNNRLTNCNKTAEKIKPRTNGNGMVLSRDVMVADVLYKVRVDAVLQRNNTLSPGVTKVPPAHLHMTRYSTDLEDAIIIGFGGVVHQKKLVFKTIGENLKRLQVGSQVGVLMDSSSNLHLYIDGQDQGVAAKNVRQPCFAVFNIFDTVIKVSALPTSRRT